MDKKLKFSTKNAENMSTKLRNNERDKALWEWQHHKQDF